MRNTDERMALVTARTAALTREQERRTFAGLSALSTVLLSALLIVIGRFSGAGHGLSPGELTGSSLLGESAGGYVLVAVLSFAAAVAITVLCFRYRSSKEKQSKDEASHKSQEETP